VYGADMDKDGAIGINVLKFVEAILHIRPFTEKIKNPDIML
jgi:hypothetical protein